MRNYKTLLISSLLLLLASCTHSVHNYHVSDYNTNGPLGKKVEAYAEEKIILGFTFDVNYVARAYSDLLASCPNGELHGINTRYSTSHSFLSYTNKIVIQAHCVE